MTDLVEKMAEAYWNAYRDGYYAAGGKLDYPVWRGSRDPVRNETLRCMRFAAEALRNPTERMVDAAMDKDLLLGISLPLVSSYEEIWKSMFDVAFPTAPVSRVPRDLKPGSTVNAAVHDAHRVNMR